MPAEKQVEPGLCYTVMVRWKRDAIYIMNLINGLWRDAVPNSIVLKTETNTQYMEIYTLTHTIYCAIL